MMAAMKKVFFQKRVFVAAQEKNSDVLTEKILWAEAFVLVYSVTDQKSFDEINRLKLCISHTRAEKVGGPKNKLTLVGEKITKPGG